MNMHSSESKNTFIPEGTYMAIITDMDLKIDPWQIVVSFTLYKPKLKNHSWPVTLKEYYELTPKPKSKLRRKLIKPLVGRYLLPSDYKDGKFDLRQFLFKKCFVEVKHKRKQNGGVIAFIKEIKTKKGQE